MAGVVILGCLLAGSLVLVDARGAGRALHAIRAACAPAVALPVADEWWCVRVLADGSTSRRPVNAAPSWRWVP